MKYIQVLVDNSSALLSWLLALFGVLTLLHVIDLDKDQITGIMTFAGATIGLAALLLTVAKRQVVTRVDSDGVIRNGPASTEPTGEPSAVDQDPVTGLLTPAAPVKPSLL